MEHNGLHVAVDGEIIEIHACECLGSCKQWDTKYSQQQAGQFLERGSVVRAPINRIARLPSSRPCLDRSPPPAQPNLPPPLDNRTHTLTHTTIHTPTSSPTRRDDDCDHAHARPDAIRSIISIVCQAHGACRPFPVLPAIVAANARLATAQFQIFISPRRHHHTCLEQLALQTRNPGVEKELVLRLRPLAVTSLFAHQTGSYLRRRHWQCPWDQSIHWKSPQGRFIIDNETTPSCHSIHRHRRARRTSHLVL